MPYIVWFTGQSGTGKSTLCTALEESNIDIRCFDLDEFGIHVNKQYLDDGNVDWTKTQWIIPPEVFKLAKAISRHRVVALFGCSSNMKELVQAALSHGIDIFYLQPTPRLLKAMHDERAKVEKDWDLERKHPCVKDEQEAQDWITSFEKSFNIDKVKILPILSPVDQMIENTIALVESEGRNYKRFGSTHAPIWDNLKNHNEDLIRKWIRDRERKEELASDFVEEKQLKTAFQSTPLPLHFDLALTTLENRIMNFEVWKVYYGSEHTVYQFILYDKPLRYILQVNHLWNEGTYTFHWIMQDMQEMTVEREIRDSYDVKLKSIPELSRLKQLCLELFCLYSVKLPSLFSFRSKELREIDALFGRHIS
jgi:gluconate kinase